MGGVVAFAVTATFFALAWWVAGRPVSSTGELAAQAQLLGSAVALLLSEAVAGTTIYYAVQTRELVVETRRARLEDQRAREIAASRDRARRVEGVGTALLGAANDAVGAGSTVATLVRLRPRTAFDHLQPLTATVSAVSRALEEVRYLEPGKLADAGSDLFDVVMEFFTAATNGSDAEDLQAIAERVRHAKDEVSDVLRERVAELLQET